MVNTYEPTIADVRGNQPWSALENLVLQTCQLGYVAVLEGKEDLPKDKSDPDQRIRPALIRYLMLGGCKSGDNDSRRPHPKGVMIMGGWIDGELDLESCHSPLDLKLPYCLFLNGLNLKDAEIGGLYLPGCRINGAANLQRLKTETDVHFDNGFHASASVDLGSARIGGQVSCEDGKFINPTGDAINLNAATVGASVFLSGTEFRAEGEVHLLRAQISGQVACVGGRFKNEHGPAINAEAAVIGTNVFLYDARVTGPINMTQAQIAGSLACHGLSLDGPLNMNAAKITQNFQWRSVKGKIPTCDLRNAHVGTLIDDTDSWAQVDVIGFSGLRYDRLEYPLLIDDRLDWLYKNAVAPTGRTERGFTFFNEDPKGFNPGPWSQLAQTLDQAGQRSMAADVRYDRDNKQRQAEYDRARARLKSGAGTDWPLFHAKMRYVGGWFFRTLFGYGHMPARVLYVIAGIVAFAFVLYGTAYSQGQMAPNSDVILTSKYWADAAFAYANGDTTQLPLRAWDSSVVAIDYETFNPFLYAVDLFVPLDALGQENAWAPSKDRGFWGWLGYWARAPIQMSGWIITAVGAAVLTGLVGRKD